MKYNIGELLFKTKKDAENYTRNHIKKLGYCSIDKNHQSFMFFLDLINNHSELEEKIGSGIDKFIIKPNVLNTTAFEMLIKRTDGTKIDFSWLKCSTSSCNTIIDNLKSAMRQYISNDIDNFRKKAIMKCVFCNCIDNIFHVDHNNPSFIKLFNDFIKIYRFY